jgi:two-component system, OmpR family, KDP operon response regulator KdpE
MEPDRPSVLIVEDHLATRRFLADNLSVDGFEPLETTSAAEAVSRIAAARPDVVVLDLGLPDVDGLEVCRRIRTWSDVPIVVLSADGTEDRKVEALDLGADDYVTKPFGMRELDARLRVAMRHRLHDGHEPPTELEVGRLRLDLVHREATLDGASLDLAPKEFEFLAYLAHNAGKVCTRRMILENVWGRAYRNELQYLKVYAYRIRRKLNDEEGHLLQSDPAVGYRLSAPGD